MVKGLPYIALLFFLESTVLMPSQTQAENTTTPLTHPLMPGVRSSELWNTDWPRTLHDKQLSGFSPLTCGMETAPQVWATLNVGGEVHWLSAVSDSAGTTSLLVDDGRLRLVELDGQVRWTKPSAGSLIFYGDLRGNGHDYLLLGSGPRLELLDASSGEVEWHFQFEPAHVQVRTAVADLLPERPGLEAAVFLAYGEEGCLIHFPPTGEPEFVWRHPVVEPDEWPERADHGCSIQLDLSIANEPIIWNVRHHRCRGFNARTGEQISSLVYPLGGGQRRNYGPWSLGQGKDGHLLACILGEDVQTHVHAIRLNREADNELAWEHYYGEVYVVPGVAVESVVTADIDGDGETEMVYNVRDPERDFRSFVRVRRATDGTIKAELADHWCAAAYFGLGAADSNGLLVYAAPDGTTPEEGDLLVYGFTDSGQLQQLDRLATAKTWGPITLPSPQGNELLLHQLQPQGEAALVRYALEEGRLQAVARTQAEPLLQAPLRLVLDLPDGTRLFFLSGPRGMLEALNWEGQRLWELPLQGGAPATLSAADLDGDGGAELVAAGVGDQARTFKFAADGSASESNHCQFLAPRGRLSPLLYDLENNGKLCLVAPGSTDGEKLAVRAWRHDGTLLWETALDVSTAAQGRIMAWNAGEFLPGPRPALAISVRNGPRTMEGTYLLDGHSGEILWHKDAHWDGDIVRGFVPAGLPAAFDFDNDGIEEINMDMYSYMAMIRGIDGSFAFLQHSINIRREGALYAAQLYNSYAPVYQTPDAETPHWFSPLGHGIFGLMNPDPSEGVWREDLGYDTPPKAGLVDVDGDGIIEAGYAPQNSNKFICRNLWTGAVKWELQLPSAPNSPVLCADVDGDGKGEFLVGPYCIGTDSSGQGEIRWRAPVNMGWAAIADFDGDGKGEIACAGQGAIYILKGNE